MKKNRDIQVVHKVRTLLVDDHDMMIWGLNAVLGKYEEIEVVGTASNAAEATEALQRLKPDVVVLDIQLPDASGLDVCQKVGQLGLNTRVLMVSSFGDERTIQRAIDAGAHGYMVKSSDAHAIAKAILDVAAGRSVLDARAVQSVFSRIISDGMPLSARERMARLTEAELETLAHIADGKTNREIAEALGLCEKTVKNYVSHVMDKLDFNRRSQAAAFYAEHVLKKK